MPASPPNIGDVPDRGALVEFARASIARGSKSFGFASQIFDRLTRERAWLLYAWCRACDDIADDQDHGGAAAHPTEREALDRAAEIRRLTDLARAGQPTGATAFDCLAQLLRECPIAACYIDALLEGFDRDASGWAPRTEDDLFSYCWNVAGTVGCMMALVMGVSPDDSDTLDRACDLGIAFQLANISRDIAEDAGIDRCYLPLDWLVETDMPPGQHMHPAYRPRLALMAKWLAEYVALYHESARIGASRLRFRSRWAIYAAGRIYSQIAAQVHRAGEHAWDHRVSTSRRQKMGFVALALYDALRDTVIARRGDDAIMTRAKLWQRPL